MTTDELKQLEAEHIMQTYKRFDVILERGEGCYVYDQAGKKYLDFIGGIATCSIGHANPAVTKAVTDQVGKLTSVSNLYFTEPPILLAKKLSELSGLKKSFFCNSGAEANEAAIKLAKKITGKTDFIAFNNAFHGRTSGSLALTANEAYKKPFLPLTPNVKFAEYDNIDSLQELIDDNTAAVIIEPIQGESGIIVPKNGFLKQVRELCDQGGILMIVDEVQTGIGRTGKFYAYQHEDIMPDIVTTAKGLANGFPIAACMSNLDFEAGDHGTTLGGNALGAAAALATIDYIESHDLQKNAQVIGDYLQESLRNSDFKDKISEVRGMGLMIGVVLKTDDAKEIVNKALQAGLLCNAPTTMVIRMLPPLTVTKQEVDECVAILTEVINS
ncbi:MAG: acetylornithine transaminase [Patescibacteria group bacterium]